jgi:hypothetical protein
MDHEQEEKLIIGYRPAAEYLTGEGFTTSHSTLQKYCSPAINIGPPIEAFYGRLPAFKPSRMLAWAKSRLRPAGVGRGRDAAESAAA